MLRRLLISWLVMALAVAITAGLLPGVHIDGGIGALLLIALVWGLVNAILGPIAHLLALPLTLMTFGLFAFIVNGLLFMLTDAMVGALHVDNVGWAVLATMVLSVVSFIFGRITRRARVRH